MFKSRKNQCSYIIFLALFLFFNPILVLAQTGSVTLSMKNATLKQFFEAVEKQTTYIFSYRDAIVEGKKEVTLNVTNQPIQRLLDDVLHQRDLQYTMTGHSIVVTLKTAGKVKQVSGTVVDSNGEPIIGANVVEKGTTNGTVTDISGNFSLNIDDTGILQISYIGFNTQDVAVNGKSSLMINLKEDTQKLDEVVVVGYGVQKKSNVTGSVASIKTDDFNDLNMDVSHVIQGRVAGVNVSNGNIIIRGAASINGADPLWIVDGVPGSAPNFNDIESIEILKDAASTAIYGARGANGVIIITTKSGQEGKIQVNLGASFGVRKVTKMVDVLNPYEYVLWQQEIDQEGMKYGMFDDLDIYKSMKGTDYQDEIFGRTGNQQQYNVSVSGGNKDTKFSVSYAHNEEKSIMLGSGFSKENINAKLNTNINKWLTMDFNARFSYQQMQTNQVQPIH